MTILLTKKEVEEYIKKQDDCGIEEGDFVEIIRSAETHEKGWHNAWISSMDESVGKIGKVSGVSRYGFELDNISSLYTFPYFVLKKIEVKE